MHFFYFKNQLPINLNVKKTFKLIQAFFNYEQDSLFKFTNHSDFFFSAVMAIAMKSGNALRPVRIQR